MLVCYHYCHNDNDDNTNDDNNDSNDDTNDICYVRDAGGGGLMYI